MVSFPDTLHISLDTRVIFVIINVIQQKNIMNRPLKLFKIFIVSVLFIVGLFCFSFGQEQITITTYYPSPYGSYQNLETRRLVIGNTAMPTVDGLVHFQGIGADPAFAQDGTLYYNNSTHRFRYYDGAAGIWKDVASVAACIRLNFTTASGYQQCPAGYAIPEAPTRPENTAGTVQTSGNFLCCSI